MPIERSPTVTQTRFCATTMPLGLPPTAIVWVVSSTGSMRVTVPSPLFAIQTALSPTVIPLGSRPAGIVVVTARVMGSIRVTVPASVFATQTAPAPTTSALGRLPTPMGVSTPVGSMRTTVFASPSVIHVASAPTAIAAGPAFGSMRSVTRAVSGSRRETRPADGATQTSLPRLAT